MAKASEHVARRARQCGSYPCTRTIKPGQRYRRHVAFPGDEGAEEITRPWVSEQCPQCCADLGWPVAGARVTLRLDGQNGVITNTVYARDGRVWEYDVLTDDGLLVAVQPRDIEVVAIDE